MKSTLLALLAVLAICGCQSSSPEPAAQPTEGNPPAQTNAGGGDGIAPMTTAPVPNAPVSGSDSLQGGGSGVGSAAKGRAKDVAAQASGSSLGSGGTDPE